MKGRPFNAVVQVTVTTGLSSHVVFGEQVSGWATAYIMRLAVASAPNTNLDMHLADQVVVSGLEATPAALPEAEYRVLDDTGNVPVVSLTEKFGGDNLTEPLPFKNGLQLHLAATGGAGGTYVFSVRGTVE
jgi:hypothetical protein